MKIDTMAMYMSTAKTFILEDEVKNALASYEKKYSQKATIVWVNPDQLPKGVATLFGVSVKAKRTVIEDHLFLGTGE